MGNLAFDEMGDCLVLVHGPRAPSDEEWRSWISFVLQHGPDTSSRVVLVVTHGGAPSGEQRELLRSVMPSKGGGPLTAVLTDAPVGRALADNMGRFQRRLQHFPCNQGNAAMEFLQIPIAQRLALLGATRRLHVQLGIPCPVQL